MGSNPTTPTRFIYDFQIVGQIEDPGSSTRKGALFVPLIATDHAGLALRSVSILLEVVRVPGRVGVGCYSRSVLAAMTKSLR